MTGPTGVVPPAGGAVLFDRPRVGAVVVSGPDAIGFLHSLLSQDLGGLADGAAAPALLLNPRGRIEAVTRVLRRGPEELWLDCEPDDAARLAGRLEAYRMRVDVTIDDRSATWGRLVVRGPSTAAWRGLAEAEAGGVGAAVVGEGWPGSPGFDVLGPRDATVAVARELLRDGAVPGDDAAYEALRIACGVPRPGAEIDDRTMVQEAFLDRDAVSFSKGCFVGQEVVGRIHARGHVNRLLRHVRPVDPTAVLRPGADVDLGGRAVGSVTSSAPGLSLGYVRREVEPPAEATVGGAPVLVEALPGR